MSNVVSMLGTSLLSNPGRILLIVVYVRSPSFLVVLKVLPISPNSSGAALFLVPTCLFVRASAPSVIPAPPTPGS